MDEAAAWLAQAKADRYAAEWFVADETGTERCHAIAKWQQAVEKSIKGLVRALYDAGILTNSFETKHGVTRYFSTLLRLPREVRNRRIQSHLHGLLDEATRLGIKNLDDLTPALPSRRNTEYPFPNDQGGWTYPAAGDTFSEGEVRQLRQLAHRVITGVDRIISATHRQPD